LIPGLKALAQVASRQLLQVLAVYADMDVVVYLEFPAQTLVLPRLVFFKPWFALS